MMKIVLLFCVIFLLMGTLVESSAQSVPVKIRRDIRSNWIVAERNTTTLFLFV